MSGVFKSIKKLFSPPKPKPAPPPVAPTFDNSAAKLDAAAEAQRQAVMRGRTSTILTGGDGLDDLGESTKKLLGS